MVSHLGNVFGLNPVYNGVLYSIRKKWLPFFRWPNVHIFILTWFRKLRLVDPPNTDHVCVCVVNTSLSSVSILIKKIMQAAMESRRQQEALRNV